MTEKISLNLTLEELEIIDKYIELNDDTRQLFDKIRSAYPKSPVEAAYKDWWGEYPGTENWTSDATRWQGFQAGYEFAYAISTAKEVMEKVQEEQEEDEWKSVALRFGEKLSGYLSDGYYELSPAAWFRWAVFTYGKTQQVKELVKESVKWCEENPDKDPLDCLKPQTPEQVADGLKEAFREAVKQGIIPEVDKVRDVFMNEMVEKQSKTLTDIVYRWWDDVFTTHSDWDMETSIADLIDQVEQWLPKRTDVCEEYSYETGRNHVIDVIKRNLR